MLKVNFYILTLFHRCFSKNTNLNWGRCYVANLYIITNISLRRPKKILYCSYRPQFKTMITNSSLKKFSLGIFTTLI
jgi:hypothetical protein